MVGCVITHATDHSIVGWGNHRHCGGPHAEVVALERAGKAARGATLYCTLEPCNHTGRTPPCVDAIIKAGIASVVIARRDPHPVAAGGLDRLHAAGISVDINGSCEPAIRVSDPFVHRIETGLPWVVAKWAQTLDGRIATRPPHCHSQWISNAASRMMVHRERGRVDAILTGIGTVLQDDPLLTARNVRIRRRARRVVVDPQLQTPLHSRIIESIKDAPTTIVCAESIIDLKRDAAVAMQARGVEVVPIPTAETGLPMQRVLCELSRRYQIATILVEAGPGLLTRLFKESLVNEVWVFTSPRLLGDDQAQPPVSGMTTAMLTDGVRMQLTALRRRGDDVIANYCIVR
jgi:diaminohydroxyphosphoribosylaminopyrimidine deaminase/5-amino-6-(5-phosphoribosylamino)uracil reductase